MTLHNYIFILISIWLLSGCGGGSDGPSPDAPVDLTVSIEEKDNLDKASLSIVSGDEELSLESSKTVSVSQTNQILALLGEDDEIIYLGNASRNQDAVELTSLSTAVGLVLATPVLSNWLTEDYVEIKQTLETLPEVIAVAELISSRISSNGSWLNEEDETLIETVAIAVNAADEALAKLSERKKKGLKAIEIDDISGGEYVGMSLTRNINNSLSFRIRNTRKRWVLTQFGEEDEEQHLVADNSDSPYVRLTQRDFDNADFGEFLVHAYGPGYGFQTLNSLQKARVVYPSVVTVWTKIFMPFVGAFSNPTLVGCFDKTYDPREPSFIKRLNSTEQKMASYLEKDDLLGIAEEIMTLVLAQVKDGSVNCVNGLIGFALQNLNPFIFKVMGALEKVKLGVKTYYVVTDILDSPAYHQWTITNDIVGVIDVTPNYANATAEQIKNVPYEGQCPEDTDCYQYKVDDEIPLAFNFSAYCLDPSECEKITWSIDDEERSYEQSSISFTHQFNDEGRHILSFSFVDQDEAEVDQQVIIKLEPADSNELDDSFLVRKNMTHVGHLSDDEGYKNFSIIRRPLHGVLTLLNSYTGNYSYKPDTDYIGEDDFLFEAEKDGESSDTARMSINVLDSNYLCDRYDYRDDPSIESVLVQNRCEHFPFEGWNYNEDIKFNVDVPEIDIVLAKGTSVSEDYFYYSYKESGDPSVNILRKQKFKKTDGIVVENSLITITRYSPQVINLEVITVINTVGELQTSIECHFELDGGFSEGWERISDTTGEQPTSELVLTDDSKCYTVEDMLALHPYDYRYSVYYLENDGEFPSAFPH